jgi:hypothetical protein
LEPILILHRDACTLTPRGSRESKAKQRGRRCEEIRLYTQCLSRKR